jgi:hypothetical protein
MAQETSLSVVQETSLLRRGCGSGDQSPQEEVWPSLSRRGCNL